VDCEEEIGVGAKEGGGGVGEDVVVCAEERGLDLGDGQLKRRRIHLRTRFPQRRR